MTDSFFDVGQSSKHRKISDSVVAGRLRKSSGSVVAGRLRASAKKMTDSLIDVGQSSKRRASVSRLCTNAKDIDTVAAFTWQSRKSSDEGRFRAFVSGYDTGAKEIDRELRQHFENCGGIEGISVNDQSGYAYIDFTSLESLLKALQQDKTSFCGRPLTRPLYICRGGLTTNKPIFRANICGLDTRAGDLDVLHYFKFCGEIEDICVTKPGDAYIDFASLAGLDKALGLTKVRGHHVTVFRAEIRGFNTVAGAGAGARAEEVLREHFKECGRIKGVNAGYAYIDFANQSSLFKALELNDTRVDDHSVTVREPGNYFFTSEFRAEIRWLGDIDLDDMRSHFEKFGGIAGILGILHTGPGSALVDFTNLDSLNKALRLDKSFVGNDQIAVEKFIFENAMGGY